MSRLELGAAAVLVASSLACSSWGPTPEFQPLPPGCVGKTDANVQLTVDDQAQVDLPCIGIKKGRSNLVWQGGANVKYLLIAFKEGNDPRPEDPAPYGATSKLKKAKHANKPGDFNYSVVVVRYDGSVKSVDPRLIIQP